MEKEEVKPMIDHIDAIALFVQDLAGCTTFYRDTLISHLAFKKRLTGQETREQAC